MFVSALKIAHSQKRAKVLQIMHMCKQSENFLTKKIDISISYTTMHPSAHIFMWYCDKVERSLPRALEPLKQRSGETSPQGMKPFHL